MSISEVVRRISSRLNRRRPYGPTGLDVDLDYLVYSSHKSGTQTVTATLRRSGYRAVHLHRLSGRGMTAGTGAFESYLDDYCESRRGKLAVISTFRPPMERHISSFFQRHGVGVVREGLTASNEETIIARCSVGELQRMFIEQVATQSLPGYHESLHELCDEIAVTTGDLSFDLERGVGSFETDRIKLTLFRFDQLFGSFPDLLDSAMGRKFSAQLANMNEKQWYKPIQDEFKASLKIPTDVIEGLHATKRDLIELFYPGQYEDIVAAAISRYGTTPPRDCIHAASSG